jgi:hypothetical protein
MTYSTAYDMHDLSILSEGYKMSSSDILSKLELLRGIDLMSPIINNCTRLSQITLSHVSLETESCVAKYEKFEHIQNSLKEGEDILSDLRQGFPSSTEVGRMRVELANLGLQSGADVSL